MGSTRLPGKAMLPLGGKPSLQQVIERARRADELDDLVVATPFNTDCDPIRELCKTLKVPCYSPAVAENDLISRYLYVAYHYEADYIVRIPADNPCVEPYLVNCLVSEMLEKPRIYTSNTTIQIGDYCFDGFGAEMMPVEALQWADKVASPTEREHIHKLFEKNRYYSLPFAHYSYDLDTDIDYYLLTRIFDKLPNTFTPIEAIEVLCPKLLTPAKKQEVKSEL